METIIIYEVRDDVGCLHSLHRTKKDAWETIKKQKLEWYNDWLNGDASCMPWCYEKHGNRRYCAPISPEFQIIKHEVY